MKTNIILTAVYQTIKKMYQIFIWYCNKKKWVGKSSSPLSRLCYWKKIIIYLIYTAEATKNGVTVMTSQSTVSIKLQQHCWTHLSLSATTGLEAAAAAAGADAAGAGRAIDASVASIAFWMASDGCCCVVVFELDVGTAACLKHRRQNTTCWLK